MDLYLIILKKMHQYSLIFIKSDDQYEAFEKEN